MAKTPEPTDIARAIAIANGHPDPEGYVVSFSAALAGEHPSQQEPEQSAEESAGQQAEA